MEFVPTHRAAPVAYLWHKGSLSESCGSPVEGVYIKILQLSILLIDKQCEKSYATRQAKLNKLKSIFSNDRIESSIN